VYTGPVPRAEKENSDSDLMVWKILDEKDGEAL
jgi:hypothetical protein